MLNKMPTCRSLVADRRRQCMRQTRHSSGYCYVHRPDRDVQSPARHPVTSSYAPERSTLSSAQAMVGYRATADALLGVGSGDNLESLRRDAPRAELGQWPRPARHPVRPEPLARDASRPAEHPVRPEPLARDASRPAEHPVTSSYAPERSTLSSAQAMVGYRATADALLGVRPDEGSLARDAPQPVSTGGQVEPDSELFTDVPRPARTRDRVGPDEPLLTDVPAGTRDMVRRDDLSFDVLRPARGRDDLSFDVLRPARGHDDLSFDVLRPARGIAIPDNELFARDAPRSATYQVEPDDGAPSRDHVEHNRHIVEFDDGLLAINAPRLARAMNRVEHDESLARDGAAIATDQIEPGYIDPIEASSSAIYAYFSGMDRIVHDPGFAEWSEAEPNFADVIMRHYTMDYTPLASKPASTFTAYGRPPRAQLEVSEVTGQWLDDYKHNLMTLCRELSRIVLDPGFASWFTLLLGRPTNSAYVANRARAAKSVSRDLIDLMHCISVHADDATFIDCRLNMAKIILQIHNIEFARAVLCKVCMTRKHNELLNPCRHVTCCSECAVQLLSHTPSENIKCPVCKDLGTAQLLHAMRSMHISHLTDDALLCRICMTDRLDTLLMPCRHVVCCSKCTIKMLSHTSEDKIRCPVCRCKVDNWENLNIS